MKMFKFFILYFLGALLIAVIFLVIIGCIASHISGKHQDELVAADMVFFGSAMAACLVNFDDWYFRRFNR